MNVKSNSRTMRDWKSFKSGKLRLRTWTVNPEINKREMKYKDIEEIRSEKAEILKRIRTDDLGLSQSELARVLHVSVRTLQGWEIGKSSVPGPAFVLLELFRDIPAVRKRLALV
jgi:DNA-binding transcriptional regulator YiaG